MSMLDSAKLIPPAGYKLSTDGESQANKVKVMSIIIILLLVLAPIVALMGMGDGVSYTAKPLLIVFAIIFSVVGYKNIDNALHQGKPVILWMTLLIALLSGFFSGVVTLMYWAIFFISLAAVLSIRKGRTSDKYMVSALNSDIASQSVIGQAGVGLMTDDTMDNSKISVENATKGMIGERKSDELFRQQLAEYGMSSLVQVVHGLRYPDSEKADVDHALICGNRVAFIDSKYWATMNYTWYGDVILATNGHSDPRPIRSGFTNAVMQYANILAPVEVVGMILIHPNGDNPNDLVIDNTNAGNHPLMVHARDGIGPILNWFQAGINENPNQYARMQNHSLSQVMLYKQ